MKTAISIPDELFKAAERVAARLGLSRSELYQRALAKYLESQSDAAITAQLDEIYGDEERGELDAGLDAMQRGSIVREDW
jgi:metal-responsive CopG/Arc/MetJ family transcriptional regulator